MDSPLATICVLIHRLASADNQCSFSIKRLSMGSYLVVERASLSLSLLLLLLVESSRDLYTVDLDVGEQQQGNRNSDTVVNSELRHSSL